jgi:Asp-tRNA(Asn)/Glu-tRNA(Gln) amidotransferase A subunit family amidase
MTLATLPRSSSLPMSPSQARARVAAAASALQRTIDDLYAADKAQAAQRERDRAESDTKAKRLVSLAQARQATRELRVEVPAKWFWNFSAEALDAFRELAKEAKQQGQRGLADSIERRVDAICTELERIQKRTAR